MKPGAMNSIAEARGVTRDFQVGNGLVHALRGVDLRINQGELVALCGRSGSGKTTLLNILMGLDTPTEGQVWIFDQDITRLHETARARLRREGIGMIFQNAHLFPSLTAQENVEIPLRLVRMNQEERIKRAREVLERVGLGQRIRHRSTELSGGEQQRVALARALVHKPRFIVADEPTGNLDSLTGREVARLLHEIAHQEQIGLLVATHDSLVVSIADRTVNMHDGRVSEEV